MGGNGRLAALASGLLLAMAGPVACGGEDGAPTATGASSPPGVGALLASGEQASDAESAQADRALRGFLALVARGDWKAVCAAMAASTVDRLEEEVARSGLPKGCAMTAAKLAGLRSARSLRADAKQAEVLSLRVDGDRAAVLYRGHEGARLALPMAREDGAWRPAALVGTPIG